MYVNSDLSLPVKNLPSVFSPEDGGSMLLRNVFPCGVTTQKTNIDIFIILRVNFPEKLNFDFVIRSF
jgi:hypothetical protein